MRLAGDITTDPLVEPNLVLALPVSSSLKFVHLLNAPETAFLFSTSAGRSVGAVVISSEPVGKNLTAISPPT